LEWLRWRRVRPADSRGAAIEPDDGIFVDEVETVQVHVPDIRSHASLCQPLELVFEPVRVRESLGRLDPAIWDATRGSAPIREAPGNLRIFVEHVENFVAEFHGLAFREGPSDMTAPGRFR